MSGGNVKDINSRPSGLNLSIDEQVCQDVQPEIVENLEYEAETGLLYDNTADTYLTPEMVDIVAPVIREAEDRDEPKTRLWLKDLRLNTIGEKILQRSGPREEALFSFTRVAYLVSGQAKEIYEKAYDVLSKNRQLLGASDEELKQLEGIVEKIRRINKDTEDFIGLSAIDRTRLEEIDNELWSLKEGAELLSSIFKIPTPDIIVPTINRSYQKGLTGSINGDYRYEIGERAKPLGLVLRHQAIELISTGRDLEELIRRAGVVNRYARILNEFEKARLELAPFTDDMVGLLVEWRGHYDSADETIPNNRLNSYPLQKTYNKEGNKTGWDFAFAALNRPEKDGRLLFDGVMPKAGTGYDLYKDDQFAILEHVAADLEKAIPIVREMAHKSKVIAITIPTWEETESLAVRRMRLEKRFEKLSQKSDVTDAEVAEFLGQLRNLSFVEETIFHRTVTSFERDVEFKAFATALLTKPSLLETKDSRWKFLRRDPRTVKSIWGKLVQDATGGSGRHKIYFEVDRLLKTATEDGLDENWRTSIGNILGRMKTAEEFVHEANLISRIGPDLEILAKTDDSKWRSFSRAFAVATDMAVFPGNDGIRSEFENAVRIDPKILQERLGQKIKELETAIIQGEEGLKLLMENFKGDTSIFLTARWEYDLREVSELQDLLGRAYGDAINAKGYFESKDYDNASKFLSRAGAKFLRVQECGLNNRLMREYGDREFFATSARMGVSALVMGASFGLASVAEAGTLSTLSEVPALMPHAVRISQLVHSSVFAYTNVLGSYAFADGELPKTAGEWLLEPVVFGAMTKSLQYVMKHAEVIVKAAGLKGIEALVTKFGIEVAWFGGGWAPLEHYALGGIKEGKWSPENFVHALEMNYTAEAFAHQILNLAAIKGAMHGVKPVVEPAKARAYQKFTTELRRVHSEFIAEYDRARREYEALIAISGEDKGAHGDLTRLAREANKRLACLCRREKALLSSIPKEMRTPELAELVDGTLKGSERIEANFRLFSDGVLTPDEHGILRYKPAEARGVQRDAGRIGAESVSNGVFRFAAGDGRMLGIIAPEDSKPQMPQVSLDRPDAAKAIEVLSPEEAADDEIRRTVREVVVDGVMKGARIFFGKVSSFFKRYQLGTPGLLMVFPLRKIEERKATADLQELTARINSEAAKGDQADQVLIGKLKGERTETVVSYMWRKLGGGVMRANAEMAEITERYIRSKEMTDIQRLLLEGIHTDRVLAELLSIAEIASRSLLESLFVDRTDRTLATSRKDYETLLPELERESAFYPAAERELFRDQKRYWETEAEWVGERKEQDSKWRSAPAADERRNIAEVLEYARNNLEGRLRDLLDVFVEEAGIGDDFRVVSVRTKSETSAEGKLQKLRQAPWAQGVDVSVADLLDLVGGRIVVEDLVALEKVMVAIERIIAVKQSDPRFAGMRILRKENKFVANEGRNDPYRAIQYTITFPGRDGNEYTFELQLKTFSAMIASDLYHNVVYKNLHDTPEAMKDTVSAYNWGADVREAREYLEVKRAKGQSVPELTVDEEVEKAIAGRDYNTFFDLVLSKIDDSVFADATKWHKFEGWVRKMIEAEKMFLVRLGETERGRKVLEQLAMSAHDRGYWGTKDVQGAVTDPENVQLGYSLPRVAVAMLTEKGRASYEQWFTSFNRKKNKFSARELDLQSLDREQLTAFLRAVGKYPGARQISDFMDKVLAGDDAALDKKIMNIYHAPFEKLLSHESDIRNPEERVAWRAAIFGNQLDAVASTVLLAEIGGVDCSGGCRDLGQTVASAGGVSYSLREKLIHEIWIFAQQYNGIDHELARIPYAEFVGRHPELVDLDRTLDHAILNKLIEHHLSVISERLAGITGEYNHGSKVERAKSDTDIVMAARLQQAKAELLAKYIKATVADKDVADRLCRYVEDKYTMSIRRLLANGEDGAAELRRLAMVDNRSPLSVGELGGNLEILHFVTGLARDFSREDMAVLGEIARGR